MTSSQELLARQSRRFMRDLDKLVMTDTNIRGLITQVLYSPLIGQ